LVLSLKSIVNISCFFTARCYAERDIAAANRPSVRVSVCLCRDCRCMGYRSHMLEYFENNFMDEIDYFKIFTFRRLQYHGHGSISEIPGGIAVGQMTRGIQSLHVLRLFLVSHSHLLLCTAVNVNNNRRLTCCRKNAASLSFLATTGISCFVCR